MKWGSRLHLLTFFQVDFIKARGVDSTYWPTSKSTIKLAMGNYEPEEKLGVD